MATAVGSDEERIVLTDLAALPDQAVDMRTIVIVGNSTTRVLDGWLVTPRGYPT